MLMKRGCNKTVTVLTPCERGEQHGVATFLREFRDPQPVRVVTAADFKRESNKHQDALSTMWDHERDEFRAVLSLLSALQSRDSLAIARAREYVERAHKIKRDRDEKSRVLP